MSRAELTAAVPTHVVSSGILVPSHFKNKAAFHDGNQKAKSFIVETSGVNIKIYSAVRRVDNDRVVQVLLEEGNLVCRRLRGQRQNLREAPTRR